MISNVLFQSSLITMHNDIDSEICRHCDINLRTKLRKVQCIKYLQVIYKLSVCLLIVEVISYFGFKDMILVPIVRVPSHCLLFTFNLILSLVR